MSRGLDEWDGGDRLDQAARAEDPRELGVPSEERPGAHRSPDERERNQRAEVREADKADARRLAPYSTEQRMLGLLAELGERYRLDYQREYTVRDEANDWYVTHVDFAWPKEQLVIEVYGGVHRDSFFDPTGTRAEDDRQRIDDVQACGWRVLIVHDTELTRKRWRGTVAKVAAFLDKGRGRESG